MLNPSEVLKLAKETAVATSLAVYERDGKRDCGSCGGAIMYLDKRSKLAKVAIAEGYAYDGGDVSLNRESYMADGIRSQNADIPQDAMREFRRVLIANGYEKAIKKFWTYVD